MPAPPMMSSFHLHPRLYTLLRDATVCMKSLKQFRKLCPDKGVWHRFRETYRARQAALHFSRHSSTFQFQSQEARHVSRNQRYLAASDDEAFDHGSQRKRRIASHIIPTQSMYLHPRTLIQHIHTPAQSPIPVSRRSELYETSMVIILSIHRRRSLRLDLHRNGKSLQVAQLAPLRVARNLQML